MSKKITFGILILLVLASGVSLAASDRPDYVWLTNLQPYLLFDLFILMTGICGYWLYKVCFHLRATH